MGGEGGDGGLKVSNGVSPVCAERLCQADFNEVGAAQELGRWQWLEVREFAEGGGNGVAWTDDIDDGEESCIVSTAE